MTPDEAQSLATTLVSAFDRPRDTAAAYAFAIKDFDLGPMTAAIGEAIKGRERLPSVKVLIGAYYGHRNRVRAEGVKRGDVACVPCRTFGGHRVIPGGKTYPPRAAEPPMIQHASYTDDNGQRFEIWPYDSSCAFHGAHVLWAELARRRGPEWVATHPAPDEMDPEWIKSATYAFPEDES